MNQKIPGLNCQNEKAARPGVQLYDLRPFICLHSSSKIDISMSSA